MSRKSKWLPPRWMSDQYLDESRWSRIAVPLPFRLSASYRASCAIKGIVPEDDLERCFQNEELPSVSPPGELLVTSLPKQESQWLADYSYQSGSLERNTVEDELYLFEVKLLEQFKAKCRIADTEFDDEVKILMKARCGITPKLEDPW